MTLENLRELKKLAYLLADETAQYVCIHILDAIIDGVELGNEEKYFGQAYFKVDAKTALKKFLRSAGIDDAKVYGDEIIIWDFQKHHCAAAIEYVIEILKDAGTFSDVLNLTPTIDFAAEYEKSVEEKARAARLEPFKRVQWLHSEESKFLRRHKFWQWIRYEFFRKHRRDVATPKILLAGMVIGGYSPREVIEFAQNLKIEDSTLASIGINLRGENFSEEEIKAAEKFVVDLVKARFAKEIPREDYVSVYFDEPIYTPFGVIYKKFELPKKLPKYYVAEMDAAKMLDLTVDEFKFRAQNIYELTTYEFEGKIYYDYDVVADIVKIINEESQAVVIEVGEYEKYKLVVDTFADSDTTIIFDGTCGKIVEQDLSQETLSPLDNEPYTYDELLAAGKILAGKLRYEGDVING